MCVVLRREDGAGERFSLTPLLSFEQTPRVNCVLKIQVKCSSVPQELR